MVRVGVRRLHPDLPLPTYAHEGDAGADLVCSRDVELEPGERAVVPTGLVLELPHGWAGLVLPRSGLAARTGLTVLNAPGLVDPGYRGEVHVVLLNTDLRREVRLARGDRVAQLVLSPVSTAHFHDVPEPVAGGTGGSTARGTGGLGSTGGAAALGGRGD